VLGLIVATCEVFGEHTTHERRANKQAELDRQNAEISAVYKSIIATFSDAQREIPSEAQEALIACRDKCAASNGVPYGAGTRAPTALAQATSGSTIEQTRLLAALEAPATATDARPALAAAYAKFNTILVALNSIDEPDDSVKTAQPAWLKCHDTDP
jgi:uncharacterized protein YecT (DUF1311 family)